MGQGARQRRAIYTALSKWLSEEQVIQALQIFQGRYQGRSSIGLHEYVAEISPLYAAEVDAATLRRELMKMLVADDAVLAPDPLTTFPELRPQAEDAPATVPATRLGVIAFHELVIRVVKFIPQEGRLSFHEHVARHLKASFGMSSYETLVHYMVSSDPKHIQGMDDLSLRQLFTVLYSATCEVLGPVQADQLFSAAFEQLRALHPRARAELDRFL